MSAYGSVYNKSASFQSVTSDDLEIDDGTLSIDASNNRIGIGDTVPGTQLQVSGTAPYVTLKNSTAENTAGGCESILIFEGHGNNALGQLEVSHVGSSDDEKGQLILKTNNDSGLQTALTISEAQKITAAGDMHVTGALTTTTTAAVGTNTTLGTAGNTTAVTVTTITNTGTNVGKALTVAAGSTTTGSNDLNGGNLVLKSGDGDGTGVSSIEFYSKKTAVDATAKGMTLSGGDASVLTIGSGAATDTYLNFDGNAQDFRIGLDDGNDQLEIGHGTAHGTNTAITVNSSGQVSTFNIPAAAVAQASDHIIFLDGGATGAPKAESIDDFLTAIAGSGVSVSSSQLTASGGAANNDVDALLHVQVFS